MPADELERLLVVELDDEVEALFLERLDELDDEVEALLLERCDDKFVPVL